MAWYPWLRRCQKAGSPSGTDGRLRLTTASPGLSTSLVNSRCPRMPKRGGCSPACFPQPSVFPGEGRGTSPSAQRAGLPLLCTKARILRFRRLHLPLQGSRLYFPRYTSGDLTLAVIAVTFLGLAFYLEKRDSRCHHPGKLPREGWSPWGCV